jgi:hypothetical protein
MKLQESFHLGNGSRMFFTENKMELLWFSAFQSLMRFNPMQLSDFVEPLSWEVGSFQTSAELWVDEGLDYATMAN